MFSFEYGLITNIISPYIPGPSWLARENLISTYLVNSLPQALHAACYCTFNKVLQVAKTIALQNNDKERSKVFLFTINFYCCLYYPGLPKLYNMSKTLI